jgi:hypothetical protein
LGGEVTAALAAGLAAAFLGAGFAADLVAALAGAALTALAVFFAGALVAGVAFLAVALVAGGLLEVVFVLGLAAFLEGGGAVLVLRAVEDTNTSR